MPVNQSIFPIWVQFLLALAPAIAAGCAAIALWMNVIQSRRSNRQSRSAVVVTCLERFADDEDMQSIFYSIEYSKFKYDRETFANSIEEKQLDKLLMNFSTAALAWKANLLKNEDLHPLQYLVRRTVRDFGVAEYLKFVSSWASRAELGEHPYHALSEMVVFLEKPAS